MPTTPKPAVSLEQRLKVLGETLKALSPKDRADAIRVASNLLARKANKKVCCGRPSMNGDDTGESE